MNFSYDTIKEIVHNKFAQIDEELSVFSEASNIGLFSGIVSSLTNYLLYMIKMETRENYFDTVLDPKNLAYLARNYSYSIGRPVSPMITVEYLGHNTDIVSTNQYFGKIGDYEIYYGGRSRQVEYGDKINLSVGLLGKMSIDMKDGLIKAFIEPSRLKAIDNDFINVSTYSENDQLLSVYQISPLLEDFTDNKPSNISNGKFATEVYLTDNSRHKRNGIITDGGVAYFVINYLETNGYEPINTIDIKLDDKVSSFGIVGVSSFGMDEEDDESIKTYAKLQYLTNKRMITPRDHDAILSNFSQFKKVCTVRDIGKPKIVKLQIDSYDTLVANKELIINTGRSDLTGEYNTIRFPISLRGFKNPPYDYNYDDPQDAVVDYYTPNEDYYKKKLNEAYVYFKTNIESVTTRIKIDTYIDEDNPLNSYMTLQIDPKLDLTFESYWNPLVIQKGVLPEGCCSFFVYYIHKHTHRDDVVVLTQAEMDSIAEKTLPYKGNSQLIFVPAQAEIIKIKIAFSSYTDEDNNEIIATINEVIEKEFRYVMDKDVSDSIMLASIHNALSLKNISMLALKINQPFAYRAEDLRAKYLYIDDIIYN